MTTRPNREPGGKGAAPKSFIPARLRHRHDGWTPARQVAFVEALGECACVAEACARVGMAASSAYALRRRPEAESFRQAWDIALDYAVRRLSDAAFSRALNGVTRPVFFQGEQVGERRYYNDRLTMFLLRYRDPVRYGAWLDRTTFSRHPEGAALTLAEAVRRVGEDAEADALGLPRPGRPPIVTHRHGSGEESEAEREDRERAEFYANQPPEGEDDGDVA